MFVRETIGVQKKESENKFLMITKKQERREF